MRSTIQRAKERTMRIAVIGVGGTGAYFGGLLARAGEDVIFIARGKTLNALRERGLTVKSKQLGELILPVEATDDPASLGPVDLILFCVKTYDTADAARSLSPLVGPQTMLLSVQNGIGNEEQIAAVIGSEHVLGCVALVSAVPEAPGVIRIDAEPGIIRFGEFGGGTSKRTAPILTAFQRTPFTTILHDDMPLQLWYKLIGISGFSGVCSLCRLPLGLIWSHPESRQFYIDVMSEVVAVGQARGVALARQHLSEWIASCEQIPPRAYGSMYHDLAAGRRLELESLNGAVVRLGREAGVPTPYNAAIYAALQPYINGTPVLP
jgi:2-dehydropantoate 2-reductase